MCVSEWNNRLSRKTICFSIYRFNSFHGSCWLLATSRSFIYSYLQSVFARSSISRSILPTPPCPLQPPRRTTGIGLARSAFRARRLTNTRAFDMRAQNKIGNSASGTLVLLNESSRDIISTILLENSMLMDSAASAISSKLEHLERRLRASSEWLPTLTLCAVAGFFRSLITR